MAHSKWVITSIALVTSGLTLQEIYGDWPVNNWDEPPSKVAGGFEDPAKIRRIPCSLAFNS